MDNFNDERDYVSDALQTANGGSESTKKAPVNNGTISNAGKAHVSLIAILLIFIIVVFVNLGFLFVGAIIGLGSIAGIVWGIAMGIVAILMYPSLADSGYTVSTNVYIFIFSFLISISYLVGMFLGGIIGLIIVVLALYWILSNNNLLG